MGLLSNAPPGAPATALAPRGRTTTPARTLAQFDPNGTFKMPAPRGSQHVGEVAAGGPPRAVDAGRADVVVVGNGIAGLTAAMEARRYAPDASVALVTEQNHPTINTPALKQFGAGRLQVEQLLAFPAGTERDLGISVVQARADTLDPRAHTLRLADGQTLRYGRLLLATGARASGLPPSCPGRDFDGVQTLHSLHDYQGLLRRLPGVAAAVVIGGGYHAAETAMLLRHRHMRVTWLIRGRGIVSDQLDAAASDLVVRQIERMGVEVRLETEVAGIVGRIGAVAGVVTAANEFIPCQIVVPCTGTRPDVDLAQGTGLALHLRHGVRVNERLETAAADVYAAGAVAAVRDPQTGQRGARGQWYFAFQQGRLAAAAMMGAAIPAGAELGALGSFWHATQFDRLGILAAGAPLLSERDHPDYEVYRDGDGKSWYRRIVVREGRLVGYLAAGGQTQGGLAVKRMIDEQLEVAAVARQLLTREFDVREVFTHQRLHALQSGHMPALPAPAPARSAERVPERPRDAAQPAVRIPARRRAQPAFAS